MQKDTNIIMQATQNTCGIVNAIANFTLVFWRLWVVEKSSPPSNFRFCS